MPPLPDTRGFSLIEALVASAIVASAIVTLAHLMTTGAAQTSSARRTMMAIVLAQSKLEELRSLPFRFAADGSRVGSEALAPSPSSSLTQDVAGWVDELDRFGAAVPDRQPPHYRRRWCVSPLNSFDVDTLVLQVCVFAPGVRAPDIVAETCLSGIRTRKP